MVGNSFRWFQGKTCNCHCTCSTPRMCKAAGSMPKLQPAITNKWTSCARNASVSLCDSIFVPFLEARSCNTDVQGYYTSQRLKNCITAEEGPDVHCVHEMEFNNNSNASQTSLGGSWSTLFPFDGIFTYHTAAYPCEKRSCTRHSLRMQFGYHGNPTKLPEQGHEFAGFQRRTGQFTQKHVQNFITCIHKGHGAISLSPQAKLVL